MGVENKLTTAKHRPNLPTLIHSRNRRSIHPIHSRCSLMSHGAIRAPIISATAGEKPRCPDASVAGVVGGNPVDDVVVGGPAGIEELDADEEATGANGVDLVVNTLLGADEGEAERPVGRHGPGGEDGGSESVRFGDVVVGSGQSDDTVSIVQVPLGE